MKSILDPSFRYVGSVHTDLRETFKRIRENLRIEAEARLQAQEQDLEQTQRVIAIFESRRK